MKVAVSIPDDTFAHAESLAKRLNTSRSRLYAKALAAFVKQHDQDSLTAQMNAVLAEIEADPEAAEELDNCTNGRERQRGRCSPVPIGDRAG